MKNDLLPLNSIFLKNSLHELEIKQWWLAEQIGVDRKTVQRWIQGGVRSVKKENIDALAKILNCNPLDLVLKDEQHFVASADDQKEAAKLILSSSIVDKLGPLGEWNVIESLLKATIIENLPLQVLGEMYAKLVVSLWRQSKIGEAWDFNLKAEAIALKLDDKELLAKSLLSKANIYSWRGQSQNSIKTYEECLALKKHIDPKSVAAAHSNLGGVLYEIGDFDQGLKNVDASIALYEVVGTSMNLCIAHIHKAIINLRLKNFEFATHETKMALDFAKNADYKRGIYDTYLIMAELHALDGKRESALELIQLALAGFESFNPPIEEGLSFEFIGRTHRHLKNYTDSIEALFYGIEISKGFPLYRAYLHYELSLTYRASGNELADEEEEEALRLFHESEAYLMVAKIKAGSA